MLLKTPCPISAHDTAQTLHDKLAQLGADAIVEALCKLDQGSLIGAAQDDAQAIYAAKLNKAEAQIEWIQSASQVGCAVRAYNPVPGAYSALNGTTIKIWQASLSEDGQGEPGTVLAVNKDSIRVACGRGAINLEVLQRPNGKSLPAAQFMQGFMIKVGDRFTTI
jgi:methionyl-tRNA formyltransferase